MTKHLLVACLLLLQSVCAIAQYPRQDTLRESNGRGRDWWDVLRYDLRVYIDCGSKTVSGKNSIQFKLTRAGCDSLQSDRQSPLELDSVLIETIDEHSAARLAIQIWKLEYDRGAAVVHMIRMMINDDSAFRQLLRGLNRDFYHKIVTSKEVEDYISKFVGWDLKPFFDVYLRSAKVPTLVVWTVVKERKVYFTWKDANPWFKAPLALSFDAGRTYRTFPRSPDELSYDTYIQRRDMRVRSLGLFQIEEKEK